MEERVKFLIDSYGLELLLDLQDIEQEYVLTLLVEQGIIDIKEYFEDDNH